MSNPEEISEVSNIRLKAVAGKRVVINRKLQEALAYRRVLKFTQDRPKGRSNPFAEERISERKKSLGDGGVIEVGETVQASQLMAVDVMGGFLYYMEAYPGKVVSVDVITEDLPKKFKERIEILIEYTRHLEVGDGLILDGKFDVYINEIVEGESSSPFLELPETINPIYLQEEISVAVSLGARQDLEIRELGKYSLVTSEPILAPFIENRHLQWLAEHGFEELFQDFVGLKCGAPEVRPLLSKIDYKPIDANFEKIVNDLTPLDANHPFHMSRTHNMACLLSAAGFKLEYGSREHASFTLNQFNPNQDLSHWSSGEVKNPETINYRTLKPEKAGLFCVGIFGPVKDDVCLCESDGAPAQTSRQSTCGKCGSRFGKSNQRRFRFGHIDLEFPYVPPFYRSLVAAKLDMTSDELLKLQTEDSRQVITLVEEWDDSNARLNGNRLRDFLWDYLPVLPADLRPLVPLEGGRWATSDLNDLYRRVINRNNRLKNLALLKTPDVILVNEKRMLIESVDGLLGYKKFSGPNDRPLMSLLEMIHGSIDAYPVRQDFSARVRLILSEPLADNEAELYKDVSRVLKRQSDCPILIKSNDKSNSELMAVKVVDSSEPVMKVSKFVARRLGFKDGDIVSIFLPLSPGAIREAHRLRGGSYRSDFEIHDSWVERLAACDGVAEVANHLVDVVNKREEASIASIRPARMMGRFDRDARG